MANLRRNTSHPTDSDTAKLLYTVVKQLDHKFIDWKLVAKEMSINAQAARMRFSRLKQLMEGVPPGERKTRAGRGRPRKYPKDPKGDEVQDGDGEGGKGGAGMEMEMEMEVDKEGEGMGERGGMGGKKEEGFVKDEGGVGARAGERERNGAVKEEPVPKQERVVKREPLIKSEEEGSERERESSDLDTSNSTIKFEHEQWW